MVGYSRPRVIKPSAAEIQLSRMRAQRWRKRLKHSAVLAIVDQILSITSVVTTARATSTEFSSPVTE